MYRFRNLALNPDAPYIPPRNPFQVFFLFLSVALSIPLMYGNAGSALLERVLPDHTVILWGLSLLTGSVLALLGLWAPPKWAVLGVLIERSGMILVGGAAAIYAGVLVYETQSITMVSYVFSMQLAYSAACWWRVYQLTRLFRWSITHVPPMDAAYFAGEVEDSDGTKWNGRWNEYGYSKGDDERG